MIHDAKAMKGSNQMRKGLKKSAVVLLSVFLLICRLYRHLPKICRPPSVATCRRKIVVCCVSSQEAMSEVGSGVYSSEINLLLAGIPGLPVEELSFTVTQRCDLCTRSGVDGATGRNANHAAWKR